jgi:glutamyl-tRNA reductase
MSCVRVSSRSLSDHRRYIQTTLHVSSYSVDEMVRETVRGGKERREWAGMTATAIDEMTSSLKHWSELSKSSNVCNA